MKREATESTNDVHSRKFESKLDPAFTSKAKSLDETPKRSRGTGTIGGFNKDRVIFEEPKVT